jgi:alcohol dehydrogenase
LQAVACVKSVAANVVIGFGGGSSMDVAKLVALLASPYNSQTLSKIYRVNNVRGNRLPLIQVPTTAGTGSEVTPIAIVTTGNTIKSAIVSEQPLAVLALLDAELTLKLPAAVTAATGIDAMVHAIEAYTSLIKKTHSLTC